MTRRIAALAVLCAAVAFPASAAAAPPESYIVVLKDGVSSSAVANEHATRFGAAVRYVYSAALNGYAARIEDGRVDAVRRDSRVARIERDGIATKSVTQAGATWGLDRIDQRLLPLNTTYTYNATGAGVKAYIIDTGIQFAHAQFGGRAVTGYDAIDGGSADDCDGHGTHVAGTTGGATWGVAKGVTLVSVRVLDCGGSGSWSGVIAGIDWVTANHGTGQPAVANMSLGGGAITAVDDAVRRSITDGVSYAIAAGNGNRGGIGQDACNYSPARVTQAMTVSATDKTDTRASFGNFGACVDFFAPGVGITSSTMGGGSAAWNGTSMAAPHATGTAALYLQTNTTALPATVASYIAGQTTKGIVKSSKTTNNHLLYKAAL